MNLPVVPLSLLVCFLSLYLSRTLRVSTATARASPDPKRPVLSFIDKYCMAVAQSNGPNVYCRPGGILSTQSVIPSRIAHETLHNVSGKSDEDIQKAWALKRVEAQITSVNFSRTKDALRTRA